MSPNCSEVEVEGVVGLVGGIDCRKPMAPLRLPVVLRVGKEFEGRFGRDRELERQTPPRLVRLQPKDPNIEVDIKFTPGGHFIVEILDKSQREEELRSLSHSPSSSNLVEPLTTTATATYINGDTVKLLFKLPLPGVKNPH